MIFKYHSCQSFLHRAIPHFRSDFRCTEEIVKYYQTVPSQDRPILLQGKISIVRVVKYCITNVTLKYIHVYTVIMFTLPCSFPYTSDAINLDMFTIMYKKNQIQLQKPDN